MTTPKPVVLCILDGWGLSKETHGNAVALSNTPHFDQIMANEPNATLITHGIDVGLPQGQMGNSEVGHMNIGAGRVVEMDLRKIEGAIERGEFDTLGGMTRFIDALKKSGGRAHLCGVMSDGGVHSHIDHMIACMNTIGNAGIDVALHLFCDGRDVAPRSALNYLDHLKNNMHERASIASMMGRYYAMDRDNRWERVKAAYDAMITAIGDNFSSASDAINAAYEADISDEFIKPAVIGGYDGFKNDDGLMCLNFRADRAREIMEAIGDPEFVAFETPQRPKLAIQTGFGEYSNRHNTYMDVVFANVDIKNTLGAWVSKHGKSQFRIAETEKYPHVTFFLNGGVETPETGEARYLAPSPKVATYDLQPEMSSEEVTLHLIEAIRDGGYDLIVVNYANPDMVGHTGDLEAAISACEAVDAGLGEVLDALKDTGGAMILCADHGNCETMIDPDTGAPHTAHTTNPVPVALIGGPKGATLRSGGRLADLAPSLLQLMELDVPKEMTGESLIIT